MQTYNLKVAPDNNQQRLDVFLTQSLPDISSRNFAQGLIEAGEVSVNGKPAVKSNYKVAAGDEITARVSDEEIGWEDIAPENIPLDILYEDDSLMVLNKPAGMMVHPASGCYSGTLVNAVLYHCQKLSDVNTSRFGRWPHRGRAMRPGIVHRLDRETSGLIVVAKNNKTHTNLAAQFEKRKVKKQYVALVEGLIEFDEGLINASLGRHPRHRDKKAVVLDTEAAAKSAKTFYFVHKRFKNVTLVTLYPMTGRTHQLRVHMAYLGHPILGDDKYGKKATFPRLALHAQALGFYHPVSHKFLEFSTTPPKEFLQYHDQPASY